MRTASSFLALSLGVGRIVVAAFLLALAAGPAVAQTVVTLDSAGTQVSVDTTVRAGGYASTDFSASDALEVQNASDASYKRRILLKFDTQNAIPAGVVVNRAMLYLVLKGAADATARPIGVYRVTRSFLPRQTTWSNYRDGALWTTAGGDLSPRYGMTNVSGTAATTFAWDLTQLVQQTINGDFGSRYSRVALVDNGAASPTALRAFHSSRASDPAVRPKLVISYGPLSSSTSSGPSAKLTVMQWNIRHTKGMDNQFNPDRVASQAAKFGGDVISMNEVSYYHSSYINDDLGRILEEQLEAKTGQPWYRTFVNVYGGTWGYGNLILSRLPLTSSSTRILSYRRGVVQVGVVVNGRTVNLFSTHVDYFNATYRTIQTQEAKAWMSGFGEPRIVMGDFNTTPGTSDYGIMASAYNDAWVVGKNQGVATAYNGTGATQGNSRFDYIYYSRSAALALLRVSVPDSRLNGVFPSDHDPVVATFVVN